jgi:hypothetical protein
MLTHPCFEAQNKAYHYLLTCAVQENLRRTGLDSDDEELDEANLFGDDDDDAGGDDAANGDNDGAGAAAAGSGRGRLKRRAAAAEEDADAGDAAAGGDDEGFADEVMDEAPGDGGFEVDALIADDDAADEVRRGDADRHAAGMALHVVGLQLLILRETVGSLTAEWSLRQKVRVLRFRSASTVCLQLHVSCCVHAAWLDVVWTLGFCHSCGVWCACRAQHSCECRGLLPFSSGWHAGISTTDHFRVFALLLCRHILRPCCRLEEMQQQQGSHASGSGRRLNPTMRTKAALLQQHQQRTAA